MNREQAQNTLAQWSRPWFNINSPNDVWLALLERTRGRDAVQAFRFHCFYALIEAAVGRARLAAGRPTMPVRFDPFSRLNQLDLTQWTDPVANPRQSILRATTNVAYGGNSFRENHVMEATLNGPLLHVTIDLEVPGSPRTPLKAYSADEVRDSHGSLVYEIIVRDWRTPASTGTQHR